MLGRVVGPHGLRGWLRVRYFGDGPENLLRAGRIVLGDRDDPQAGASEAYEVKVARPGRAGEVRLELSEVTSREAAEQLIGRSVLGNVAELEPLAEGEHYWFELVGCAVEARSGRSGETRHIGTVRELWETGAHDVLVVELPDGRSCLVPTAADLLLEIHAEERRIVVEDLPGLFDPVERGPGTERKS